MEWKFIKELKSKGSIKKFEDIIGMELPKDYIEFIEKYNGARPKLKLFKTITGKEHVIKTFLSFNITDVENIFSVNEWLKKDFNREYFAIASDPAGNYIVYDKKFEIYFWNHEINKFELITKTFTDFINMLYGE